MLRILSRLREIRICILQHRILIAMAQLSLQTNVALALMIFRFDCALCQILIGFVLWHESTFCNE